MADVPTRRVIYIDLDGTMVWAWSPLITTESLARLFNAKIESPPKINEGYRRLTKVRIGNDYVLACSRPNMRRFLAVLRRAAAVLMVTHARRDYALAMNRAFKFGFTANQIFTVGSKLHPRSGEAVLIDDEGECGGDYGAYQRHREKCSKLNIDAGSSHDFPVPPFVGLRNDLFSRPKAWRKIGKRVINSLNHPRKLPSPPEDDPDPPYTLADFDSPDPQERIEKICGQCLSTSEAARLLCVSNQTVLNRYIRDELISFRALRGKNQRRFPKWQFDSNRAATWLRPIIRAFGQNGWGLIEFLITPQATGTHLQSLLRGTTNEANRVLTAAERCKATRNKALASKLSPAGPKFAVSNGKPGKTLAELIGNEIRRPIEEPSGAAYATPEEGLATLLNAEGGCADIVEATALYRIPKRPTIAAVTDHIHNGFIIAYRTGSGRYRIPRWQFNPEGGGLLDGLPAVLGALRESDPAYNQLTPFSFFLQPHPLTGLRTPLEALREGDLEAAINAATSESE